MTIGFSYYYRITIILLVTVIPVYDIALTATTNTTTISRTSYVASAFSNESAITQRPDNPQVNASRTTAPSEPLLQEFPVTTGSHPHDVAPAANGIVWYTAQASGELGRLDTYTNQTHHIALGRGSAPHGVIVGPD